MLMGHTEGLPKFGSSKELLLSGHTSELEGDDKEEVISEEILYMASFEDLAANYVLYDSIIWVSISLLLVLAWGIGVLMLLYLPMRRYVLQKDMSSRKLYVTPNTIIYKVTRPSFIPFWGVTNIEKHVHLSLVIDIVIEQVESIAHGRAAPVDELQVQGISNPGQLRKVIIKEASKVKCDYGRSWKTTVHGIDADGMAHTDSLSEVPAVVRSPPKVPKTASVDYRGAARSDLLMNKIEEVSASVKGSFILFNMDQFQIGSRLEVLIEKAQTTTEIV